MKINLKKNLTMVFIIFSTIFFGANFASSQSPKASHSLKSFLGEYGFSTVESKLALEKLFRLTLVIPQGKSWDEVFPLRDQESDLVDDFVDMIEKVQEKFVIRTQRQERWAIKTPEYMRQNKHEFVENLKILEGVDPIKPKNLSPDVLCILGSRKSSVSRRIGYALHLMKSGLKPKYMVLLTGERYLDIKVDGNEIELETLAKKMRFKTYKDLTEKHMFEELYNRSDLLKYKIPTTIINTPRNDLPRPNTQTTMLELIKWLKAHKDVKNILFVSNQPHVKYQEAIIKSILEIYDSEIEFEVVGPSVTDFSNIKAGLEGIGSFIWAESPQILSKMDMSGISDETKEKLEKLYPKDSLGYRILLKGAKL